MAPFEARLLIYDPYDNNSEPVESSVKKYKIVNLGTTERWDEAMKKVDVYRSNAGKNGIEVRSFETKFTP